MIYPVFCEFDVYFICFIVFKHPKVQRGKGDLGLEFIFMVLDGNLDVSTGTPYSKIWFELQHPKVLFVPGT